MEVAQKNVRQLLEAKLIEPGLGIRYFFHNQIQPTTQLHYHDFYEFFHLIKGATIHHVNRQAIHLTAGVLVLIRPQDTHYFEPIGQTDCTYFNIAISTRSIEQLFSYLGDGFPHNPLTSSPLPPSSVLTETESKILVNRLNGVHAIELTQQQKQGTAYRIIIADILTRYFTRENCLLVNGLPDWLAELCLQMEDKSNLVGGLDTLRRLAGRSPEQVCRIFQQHLDVTPTEFINELRLNYVANLLINTDKDVLSIALECGFNNLSHLYHLFRHKHHMPPATFRKKYQRIILT